MSVKRLYLAGLMLIIGCQQVTIKQAEAGQVPENTDKPVVTKTIVTPVEVMPEQQLELNKHLLLTDQNINVRTKTASLLLASPDPNARKILIDTLGLTDNSAARIAICKALIQSRSSKDSVVNKEDFIQPLLSIFDTGSDTEVQLASDAILIFKYETIEKSLENIVTDPTKPAKTRINIIGALKNLPEINAIIILIRLVDDPDKQVDAEAEKALRSLGIPIGADSTERQNIIADLLNNGIDAFLQELLINKQTQIQQITTNLASWQKLYLTLLDKTYRSKADDTERSKFLDENLKSPKAEVRIWALDQVSQWIQGTNPNLPKLLEPALKSLISDPNKEVRIKTAVILASLRTLDSSAPLLAQLQVEPDEQVARQLLDTLGWVCSYGLSSSSPFKISPEIRQQVLDLAADYLSKGQTNNAQIGAQVLRRLLERDSLQPEEVDKKLRLFSERFNQLKGDQNDTLRGDLLKAMVGLVAKDSLCKAQAGKLFEPFFSEALDSKTDSLRETAVDGLANVDETRALITLRKKGFAKDPSSNIRIKMITLAKDVGGIDDLDWLSDNIGSNGESQLAWQAMLIIFGRSDNNILNQWMDRLTSEQSRLSVDQKIDFLKLAETKITGEDQTKAREKLAKLYFDAGLFEDAANSYRKLQESANNPREKKIYSSKLLNAYLNWPNTDFSSSSLLLKNYLLEADLEPNDVLIQSVDSYLSNQTDQDNIDALLKALANIGIASPRPKWREQLKIWTERYQKTVESNKES